MGVRNREQCHTYFRRWRQHSWGWRLWGSITILYRKLEEMFSGGTHHPASCSAWFSLWTIGICTPETENSWLTLNSFFVDFWCDRKSTKNTIYCFAIIFSACWLSQDYFLLKLLELNYMRLNFSCLGIFKNHLFKFEPQRHNFGSLFVLSFCVSLNEETVPVNLCFITPIPSQSHLGRDFPDSQQFKGNTDYPYVFSLCFWNCANNRCLSSAYASSCK